MSSPNFVPFASFAALPSGGGYRAVVTVPRQNSDVLTCPLCSLHVHQVSWTNRQKLAMHFKRHGGLVLEFRCEEDFKSLKSANAHVKSCRKDPLPRSVASPCADLSRGTASASPLVPPPPLVIPPLVTVHDRSSAASATLVESPHSPSGADGENNHDRDASNVRGPSPRVGDPTSAVDLAVSDSTADSTASRCPIRSCCT